MSNFESAPKLWAKVSIYVNRRFDSASKDTAFTTSSRLARVDHKSQQARIMPILKIVPSKAENSICHLKFGL
jgi:hypothetical protein